jgi:type I restriction enzyme R subunit
LIRNIDLSNTEQKLKDVQDIEAKLTNITDDELFLKLDLIKKFLNNVIPTLKSDDSIDDALNTHMNIERQKEIERFANENGINLEVLQTVIDEFEYSGIFPNELIGKSINAPFLKKISLIDNVKVFIKGLLRKYM